jgi:uncharacterized membrane protein
MVERGPVVPTVPRYATARIAIAAAASVAAFGVLSPHLAFREAALLAWDSGGLVLLLIAWLTIVKADARVTRQRARADDPGRTLVYALVVLTSAASLLAATVLATNARGMSPHLKRALMLQCLATVSIAWAMTHTAFTLRYAHLYYREDSEGVGGVTVPGNDPPSYFDFAYFAFTIGMCFQVSDFSVTSPQIRRAVLLHALISFAYNSLIVAFVLNLVFGLAS